MSVDSDAKLTKHTTAVTVVTAEFANSLYGGEYAGVVAPEDDEFHPSLGGHVHDGQHIDGHAARVSLHPDESSGRRHIRGHLLHANLSDGTLYPPAVQVGNVQSYEDQTKAIPEWIDPGTSGNKEYYLDLSMSAGGSDTHVQFNEDGGFGGNEGFVYKYDSGEVGIGTDDPRYLLEVVGESAAEGVVGVTQYNDAPDGPNFVISKARGDESAPAWMQVDDYYGSLKFDGFYDDGGTGAWITSAGMYAEIASTITDLTTSLPSQIYFTTTEEGDSSGEQTRLVIKHDGKIGMGDFLPEGYLTVSNVNSMANPSVLIYDQSEYGGRISFTNTEGTAGPTGDSYDWTIYGLSSADGSPENAVFNVWYGDNDGSGTGANILKILGDGKVGIGTSPGRALHVQDTSNPPIRINTLTASTGDVMVWDSSTGDVYIDSSIGSDQDLWATFTADDASTATANSTTDNLTIAGDGSSISTAISGDTLTITNASPNVDQNLYSLIGVDSSGGTHSGSPVSPVSSSDTLTLVAGSGIDLVSSDSASVGADTITITATGGPSAGSYMTTQWVGASDWVGESGGSTTTLVMAGPAGRKVCCKGLKDNSGDLGIYYTNVPVPLNQSLTAAPGPMAGAHLEGTFTGGDAVSGFAASAPQSCRVTLFFIMNCSAGNMTTVKFDLALYHAAESTPSGNLHEYSDGISVTEKSSNTAWVYEDDTGWSTNPGPRKNDHVYAASGWPADWYYAVSDFSSQPISCSQANGGMYQFKVEATNFTGGSLTVNELFLVGARLQWIWA